MPKIALLILLTLFGTALYAQENNVITAALSDTIQIRKRGGGYQFYLGENKLNSKELKQALKSNAPASGELRAARFSAAMASVFGYAGGFMIGLPLGTALGGGKPVWALAGAGAGLIAVSIPFSVNANKKARRAVNAYNTARSPGAYRKGSELRFKTTGNSAGLALLF